MEARGFLRPSFLLSGLFLLGTVGAARALEVTPGALALRQTGGALRGLFTVRNDTGGTLEVAGETAALFGYGPGEEAGARLSPARFRLKPGAARKVSLQVWATAVPGPERALAVSFLARDPRSPGVQVSLVQSVYLVPADAQAKEVLEAFSVDRTDPARWGFRARVSNRGGVHLLSTVSFAVRRRDGSVAMRFSPPEKQVINPGAEGEFFTSCPREAAVPAGAVATVTLHYRPPFGKSVRAENAGAAPFPGGTP